MLARTEKEHALAFAGELEGEAAEETDGCAYHAG